MKSRVCIASGIGSILAMSSFMVAFADTPLSASCAGSASASSIMWTASSSGGVAPVSLLWGNGSTSTSQTLTYSPGTYSMSIQATDASSTVATSTCSATVAQAAPTITSFTAAPSSITAGQSATLSWVVGNASSTSIDNGIGLVSSSSITVTPSVSTTYTLSATNPGGSTTANATVTVNATSTNPTIAAQIQALLNQINLLKQQIAQLLLQQVVGGGGSTATSTPATCFGFGRDLHRGDDGDDVRGLQQMLAHKDPTLFPPGLVNGIFGPKTESALKMLQRRFGIDISGTGFFGHKSRAFFASQCSNGDNDHDGAVNSQDADDDNDGTPDTLDAFPFNANATSTAKKADDLRKKGKELRNEVRGHDDDD